MQRTVFNSRYFHLTPKVRAKNNNIKDVLQCWQWKFKNYGVSEPLASIEHILAHVIGTRNVSKRKHVVDAKFSYQWRIKLVVK